jgi:hypothetical protein
MLELDKSEFGLVSPASRYGLVAKSCENCKEFLISDAV